MRLGLLKKRFKPTIGGLIISTFAFLLIFILFAGHGDIADTCHAIGESLSNTPNGKNDILQYTDWASKCGMASGRGTILGIVGGTIVFPIVCLLSSYGANAREYQLTGKLRHVIASGVSLVFALVLLTIVSVTDPDLIGSTIEMPLALIFTGVLYLATATYVILHRSRPEFKSQRLELEYIKLYHSQEKEAVNLGLAALATLFASLATLVYFGWQNLPEPLRSDSRFSHVTLIWTAWIMLPTIGFLLGVVSPRFWVMDELVDRVARLDSKTRLQPRSQSRAGD